MPPLSGKSDSESNSASASKLPSVALPIDPFLPRVIEGMRSGSRLLLIASPGSGKTTRVPWALVEALRASGDAGKVYVLEPRRLAAKLSAERVASENGVRIGEEVGYQFRFERRRKDSTRLVFLTEGTLLREIQSNPELRGVSIVVLDEFHERHSQGDLALALVKRLQETCRPDLRLLVMSATLDAAPLERFLPGCSKIEVDAPRFPLSIEYSPPAAKLEPWVRRTVVDLLDRPDADSYGDLLVFLPGMAEIRRAESELRAVPGIETHILHGETAKEDQERALSPSKKRKVILSTNIAESSLTIPGVSTVIDSGLARVASHSHASGLPRLETKAISRASAIQRAGRAGRTAPGRVVRLYAKGDFEGRPMQETPELLRADLASVLLELAALGLEPGKGFEFFEAPSIERLRSARALLSELGLLNEGGGLSAWGRIAAESSFHPRLARSMIEGARLGVPPSILIPGLLALAEGESFGADFIEGLARFRPTGFQARIAERMEKEFERILAGLGSSAQDDPSTSLSRSLLAGFHDRVAKREREGELVLARGGSAVLPPSAHSSASEQTHWMHSDLHLVLDLQETKRAGDLRSRVIARSSIALQEEWLWELEPSPLRETIERVFDERKKQWVEYVCIHFHSILLSRELRRFNATEAKEVLSPSEWDSLFQAWVDGIRKGLGDRDSEISPRVPQRSDAEAWAALLVRYRLLREYTPGATGFEAEDFESLLRGLLSSSYRDARSTRDFPELDVALSGLWDPGAFRAFQEEVPPSVSLPGRKRVPVHYEEGSPPRIESRLQDFFGMTDGPRILGGRRKLSLHLLAPNYRAVQMTEDLKGFWERHYPSIRKELMRRYPRHAWPENPLTATPPDRDRGRR